MSNAKVTYIDITKEIAGSRIDNFLITRFKGVPKTHIYRIIRKGEVRVNKKRIQPSYRLQDEDQIRIPPLELQESKAPLTPSQTLTVFLKDRILMEDAHILIINKPSGMAVHGGSGVKLGLIEALRAIYPMIKHLELVHRLDAQTSGCLILAKKPKILRELHALLREGKICKTYRAFTKGQWKKSECNVQEPLQKNILKSGERIVRVHKEGKAAVTKFSQLKTYSCGSLMDVILETGRTHQIRVHVAHRKHPIALDEKYGDPEFNRSMRQYGLKRLFLHAYALDFILPSTGQRIKITAPLDKDLEGFLKALE